MSLCHFNILVCCYSSGISGIIAVILLLCCRYTELVHTDSEFEPQDGFFQLFCDPHSTRLSRLHLREDVVRDRDLEAINKQVLTRIN